MKAFTGFPEAGIAFLRDLVGNNDRVWFAEHREVYKRELEGPGKDFCAAMEAASWLFSQSALTAYRDRVEADESGGASKG